MLQAAVIRFGIAPDGKAVRAVGNWLLARCTEYRAREVDGRLVAKAVFALEQDFQRLARRVA